MRAHTHTHTHTEPQCAHLYNNTQRTITNTSTFNTFDSRDKRVLSVVCDKNSMGGGGLLTFASEKLQSLYDGHPTDYFTFLSSLASLSRPE